MSMQSRSRARALATRKKRQEELALAPVNNRPVRRSDSEKRAEIMARQAAADAASNAAAPPRPPLQMPALQRRQAELKAERHRKIAERAASREVARGQGVAADIAQANIQQFNGGNGVDRGGSGAKERGAKVTGFAGTVTPGQKRGEKQTGAGKFPVYGKKMQAAQSFRSAFAQARGQGKKVFDWQGRKYTTDLA